MISSRKALGAAMFASAVLLLASGCQKQEGPVERAGKQVDNAVTKSGEQIEKAGEAIKESARDARK
ncbi:hypothetical protein [Rhodocyclus tenuis]|uniref:Uncharacterized protein n=1 Tax=Rhodocyclus tenuis TaxID=1066 RepID=A0A840G5L2_RHOTE|nr:hypothetical protein [Rhodocyclus tenuis]MBB4246280.1 hypothetical protein [Rhodocyclus tenuis]